MNQGVQEVSMIALIPGLTANLAFLQPQPAAASSSQEGFSHLLESASRSSASSEAPPPAPARYVVQAGDNLTMIAKKLGYAGPMVLARANNLQEPGSAPDRKSPDSPGSHPGPTTPRPDQIGPTSGPTIKGAGPDRRLGGAFSRTPAGSSLLVRESTSRQINGQRPPLQHVCGYRGP